MTPAHDAPGSAVKGRIQHAAGGSHTPTSSGSAVLLAGVLLVLCLAPVVRATDYVAQLRAIDALHDLALTYRDTKDANGVRQVHRCTNLLNALIDAVTPLTEIHGTSPIAKWGTKEVARVAHASLAMIYRSQGHATLYFGEAWQVVTPAWTECERLAWAQFLFEQALVHVTLGGFGHRGVYTQALGLSHEAARRRRARRCPGP